MIALPLDTSRNIFWPHGLLSAKNSAIRYNQRTVNMINVSADFKHSSMAGLSEADKSDSTDKPCRACTDFRAWTKLRRKENSSEEDLPNEDSTLKNVSEHNTNCPLTRDDLGRNTWGFLHTLAAYYPDNPTNQQKSDVSEFFKLFSRFYPCRECAEDLQRQIERFPPKTESQHELSQWLCRVHNRINLRLGKAIFDCATVNDRWRDGWKDGSCD